jgi:UDP-glucose 4-epimerase
MPNKKKVFLITGVAGFIGSHTAEAIADMGYFVKGIDNYASGSPKNIKKLIKRKNFKFKKIDIREIKKNEIFFKNVDYVIHFAGVGSIIPSIEEPSYYFENNIIGTSKVVECCINNNIKSFIYAASSSCYGIANTPTNEESSISCEHPYALSKYLGEQVSFHMSKIYNLDVKSIRIFNAYGPRINTKGMYGTVFAVFLKQILENKPLTVVGNGKQKRDYVFVSDVANAFILACLKKTKSNIFNIGSDNPKSVNELIELMTKKNHKVIRLKNRPAEPRITHADISRLKKELNWKPKISFEEGVAEIMKDINYWKSSKLWTKSSIKFATKKWFNYLK